MDEFYPKAFHYVNLCVATVISLASFIVFAIFGIFSCIPYKKYFRTRSLDFCVAVNVLTFTSVLPVAVFLIAYAIAFLLEAIIFAFLLAIGSLYDYVVRLCMKSKDNDVMNAV
jgi:hypothetical protein